MLFTARNVPALIVLATETGLVHHYDCGGRHINFAPTAPVDGDYPPLGEEDEAKVVTFCERANAAFGDRAHFCAGNRWRFASVSWSKDTRTQAQLENRD
jgi:hypothetical protein